MNTAKPSLNVLRIIIIAMMTGMLAFNVVAFVIGPVQDAGSIATETFDLRLVLLMVVLGLGILSMSAYVLIPVLLKGKVRRQFENEQPKENPTEQLIGLVVTIGIFRGALCEGLGLFAGVGLLLTGDKLFLIATGFSMMGLLFTMPTAGRLSSFVSCVTNGRWQ